MNERLKNGFNFFYEKALLKKLYLSFNLWKKILSLEIIRQIKSSYYDQKYSIRY